MKEPLIRLIDFKEEAVLDQVELLLLDMYAYMSECGLANSLVADGAKKWRTGVERTLGRLGTLAVAESEDQVIGFLRGIIKISPDHLGNQKMGFVDHTFVAASWRGKGIGRKLFDATQTWFHSKGVNQLELQVLCENTSAIKAWQAMGFEPELFQMRKRIDKTDS